MSVLKHHNQNTAGNRQPQKNMPVVVAAGRSLPRVLFLANFRQTTLRYAYYRRFLYLVLMTHIKSVLCFLHIKLRTQQLHQYTQFLSWFLIVEISVLLYTYLVGNCTAKAVIYVMRNALFWTLSRSSTCGVECFLPVWFLPVSYSSNYVMHFINMIFNSCAAGRCRHDLCGREHCPEHYEYSSRIRQPRQSCRVYD